VPVIRSLAELPGLVLGESGNLQVE